MFFVAPLEHIEFPGCIASYVVVLHEQPSTRLAEETLGGISLTYSHTAASQIQVLLVAHTTKPPALPGLAAAFQ
jgi:hypothetical protein